MPLSPVIRRSAINNLVTSPQAQNQPHLATERPQIDTSNQSIVHPKGGSNLRGGYDITHKQSQSTRNQNQKRFNMRVGSLG